MLSLLRLSGLQKAKCPFYNERHKIWRNFIFLFTNIPKRIKDVNTYFGIWYDFQFKINKVYDICLIIVNVSETPNRSHHNYF